MLMLLFQIGNERYALESKRVVEIIPMVYLRKIYRVSEYVAGILNYRGMMVPTIDLCQMIQGKKSRLALSTRIIIIHYNFLNAGESMKQENNPHFLGIIAEQVTEVIQHNLGEFSGESVLSQSPQESKNDLILSKNVAETSTLQTSNYLGKVFFYQQKMIQTIDVNYLMSATEKTALFATLSYVQNQ